MVFDSGVATVQKNHREARPVGQGFHILAEGTCMCRCSPDIGTPALHKEVARSYDRFVNIHFPSSGAFGGTLQRTAWPPRRD